MARRPRLDLDGFHLKQHFKNIKELPSRNFAILEALNDGYTQGEVARYLDVSAALVSYIFRSLND